MDPIQLSLSLTGIAVRSHRLMVDFLTRRPDLGGLGDPAGIGRAFLDLTAKMIADPMSIAAILARRTAPSILLGYCAGACSWSAADRARPRAGAFCHR
jgi:hypothetical protein